MPDARTGEKVSRRDAGHAGWRSVPVDYQHRYAGFAVGDDPAYLVIDGIDAALRMLETWVVDYDFADPRSAKRATWARQTR
jgi:hypothetical protein